MRVRPSSGQTTVVDEDGVSGETTNLQSVGDASGVTDFDAIGEESFGRKPNRNKPGQQAPAQRQRVEPETRDAFDDNDEGDDDGDDGGQQTQNRQTQQQQQQPEETPEDIRQQFTALQERYEAMERDLHTWNGLQQAAARDPRGTLQSLARAMGVELGDLAPQAAPGTSQAPAPSFDPRSYQPENAFETAFLQHYGFLNDAPGQLQQVYEAIQGQSGSIDSIYLENLALRERLAAIEEHLELEADDFDTNAFANDIRSRMGQTPNLDVAAEMREKYGKKLRDKYLVKRQGQKERPQTLSNGAGGGGGRRSRAKDFASAVAIVNEENGW